MSGTSVNAYGIAGNTPFVPYQPNLPIVVATGTSTTSFTTSTAPRNSWFIGQTIMGVIGNTGVKTVITNVTGTGPWTVTVSPAITQPVANDTFQNVPQDIKWVVPKVSDGWVWGSPSAFDSYPNNLISDALFAGQQFAKGTALNHPVFSQGAPACPNGYTFAALLWFNATSDPQSRMMDQDAVIPYGFTKLGSGSALIRAISNGTSITAVMQQWMLICAVVNPGTTLNCFTYANLSGGVLTGKTPFQVANDSDTYSTFLSPAQRTSNMVTDPPGHVWLNGTWQLHDGVSGIANNSAMFHGQIGGYWLFDTPLTFDQVRSFYNDPWQMHKRPSRRQMAA
jgi:hypothetical protein